MSHLGQYVNSIYDFFLFCPTVKHSLKTLYTVTSGFPNLPELMISVLVDNVQAGYCDSNKTISVNHDVWKKLFKDNPGLLDLCTEQCVEIQPKHFKSRLDRIMQHFNQTEGVHILQYMESCESDEQTGNTYLVEGGYDGEDFISFDVTKRKWTSQKPEADVIKQELEADKDRIEETVYLITQTSSVWLKLALNYGESFLLRTDLPSVSLLQKSPSSPVSCHATGFYPDRATMFWRKDGEELHEDVDHGEILPNHDGTFQMRVDLNISSVKPEDWRRYDCVFQLSCVEDDSVIRLDKAVIRTNWVPPSQVPAGAVIGVVVGLMLLSVCITGLFIWWKKKNGSREIRRDVL
ncbi:class I histocompatibility antigen, Gogo-OKO alpha chain-like isoform X4 [Channa argus]|uniref:class I histocompatibility antigen, Gogo-OKO alpha chain-like isoform X4 n=1 Tax=Channa argus TaxID=215402 RepID=UPI003522E695